MPATSDADRMTANVKPGDSGRATGDAIAPVPMVPAPGRPQDTREAPTVWALGSAPGASAFLAPAAAPAVVPSWVQSNARSSVAMPEGIRSPEPVAPRRTPTRGGGGDGALGGMPNAAKLFAPPVGMVIGDGLARGTGGGMPGAGAGAAGGGRNFAVMPTAPYVGDAERPMVGKKPEIVCFIAAFTAWCTPAHPSALPTPPDPPFPAGLAKFLAGLKPPKPPAPPLLPAGDARGDAMPRLPPGEGVGELAAPAEWLLLPWC